MIIVAGNVAIKPERRAAAVQAALRMAEATQGEPGCIAYQFSADLKDPNTIFVFEAWETEEALARHFQTDHMKAFQQELPQFVAGEMDIKRYNVESVSTI